VVANEFEKANDSQMDTQLDFFITVSLGLLPVLVAIYVFWKWHDPEIGANLEQSFEHGGERYGFSTTAYKGKLVACWFQFSAPTQLRFSLRSEQRMDRLAKAFGLRKEVQFGDERFDARFFVVTEDAAFLSALQSNELLRRSLKEIVVRLQVYGAGFSRIICRNGQLLLRVNATTGMMYVRSNEQDVRFVADIQRSVLICLKPFLDQIRELQLSNLDGAEQKP
jgi:hypothetical protein